MNSFKRKCHYIATVLSLLSFPHLANAGHHQIITPEEDDGCPKVVVGLSMGAGWENTSKSQTLFLTPTIEKTYAGSGATHAVADGQLFLGLQAELPKNYLGQLGLEYSTTSDAKLSGNIWDDADPIFNNYTYQYRVHHSQIAVAGKILMELANGYLPWIGGSAGIGYNDAHSFNNTPIIPEAIVMPNFASHSKTSFTYTVRVGIQKQLRSHWQAGVNYEFADWGKSELKRAPGQTVGSGLSLNHIHTNGFLFNITYIA